MTEFVWRPHQRDGANFMIDVPRCNIWMDPGLGKTTIVLSAIDILHLAGSNQFPVLVLGPLRVARAVWSREVNKWSDTFGHLEVSPVVGTEKQRIAALQRDVPIYTMNYENIPWLVDYFGKKWPFKMVVPDESTRLKNFRLSDGGQRAAALSWAAKKTGRWANLTGTPAPNGIQDLWGQMWFVDAGRRLGHTYGSFEDRWLKKDRYNHTLTPKPGAYDEIMGRIADVTMSLRAEEVFPDLQEPLVSTIEVEMPKKAHRMYDEFEREMCLIIDEVAELSAKNGADLSIKCLQLCAGAYYNEDRTAWKEVHREKILALESLHEELGHEPLLVAYHFKHDLARLKKAFPYGKVLKTKKDEDDWNECRFPMAFVQPSSIGHGLDLQYGGHRLCFFTPWWDSECHDQVIERIGPVRQLQAGFNRKVGIYYLTNRGCMDEVVVHKLRHKTRVQLALRKLVELRRAEGKL